MTLSQVKQLVKGEVGTKEYFNVKRINSLGVKIAFDLTGYTITITIYDAITRATKKVDAASVTIDIPLSGVCYFTTTAGSTDTVGRYLGRLKLVLGGETVYTKEFQWLVEANP